MKTELASVVDQVGSLAVRRGWTDVGRLIDELLPSGRVRTLLAASKDADVEPVRQWIAATAPDAAVTVLPLEGLVDDPVPALAADRLMAVLECGRLLEPTAAQAIAEAFFARPAVSYAIVLAGAERIGSQDDMELVERMAWRLLVPDNEFGRTEGDLLAHRCLMWSNQDTAEFLEGRVRRDREALAGWLRDPRQAVDEIDLQRVLHVIEAAEQQTYDTTQPAPKDLARHARRLARSRDALAELRRRLARRLDTDAASLKRQLVASLQALEQDLLQGLKPQLERGLHDSPGTDTRLLVAGYVNEGIERWQRGATELLRSRYAEIEAETEVLLQGTDWAAVNEVAAGTPHAPYPDALFEGLLASPEFRLVDRAIPDDVAGTRPQSGRETIALVRMAVAGSIVMAVAALLLGPVGPVGLVAAGAAGMIGERLLDRLISRRDAARLSETDARIVITELIRRAVATVREHTEHSIVPLRNRLNKELQTLERAMDEAVAKARQAGDQEPLTDPDREALAEARRQALSATTGP
jgi:hypothetical protein